MRKIFLVLLLFSNIVLAADPVVTVIKLPEPDLNGKVSLEQTVKNRRSVRQFTAEPLTIKQVGQLCWAAQGITEPNRGFRAAPSAGALYPMQLFVVLPDGLYLYSPKNHTLEKQIEGDVRSMLKTATFGQKVIQDSPCSFVIAGSIKKLEAKYRGRGEQFAYLEAGHIAENIHLQAVSLGLGSVPLGAFAPKSVAGICNLTEDLQVLYLVCTGNPAEKPALAPVIASSPVLPSPVKPPADIRSKRVVIVVPDKYFNDTEYFGVLNALQLMGIQPVIASSVIGDTKGLERNTITITALIKDIKVDDYDAFVFIGGPSTGSRDYFNDASVLEIVRLADKEKKILAAIGAAPVTFANAGIIKGKKIACVVSQRRKVIAAGAEWKNTTLVIEGNIITANGTDSALSTTAGSDTAQRFGTAIVGMLRQQSE